MEKIKSFTINHDTLKPGMYVSRIDGDIVTYDLRLKTPNGGDYLSSATMHTIEHLLATYVRNSSFGENVIYAGPMGCMTGFYLLLRNVSKKDAIKLCYDAFEFIASYKGKIPGSKRIECGNYRMHNLKKANFEAKVFAEILKDYTEKMLEYER